MSRVLLKVMDKGVVNLTSERHGFLLGESLRSPPDCVPLIVKGSKGSREPCLGLPRIAGSKRGFHSLTGFYQNRLVTNRNVEGSTLLT